MSLTFDLLASKLIFQLLVSKIMSPVHEIWSPYGFPISSKS